MSCVVLREIDIMNEEGEAQKKQKKKNFLKSTNITFMEMHP
jgi:hypothetical protein